MDALFHQRRKIMLHGIAMKMRTAKVGPREIAPVRDCVDKKSPGKGGTATFSLNKIDVREHGIPEVDAVENRSRQVHAVDRRALEASAIQVRCLKIQVVQMHACQRLAARMPGQDVVAR